MKSLIFFYTFLFTVQSTFSQILEIDWQRTYGGSSWDIPYSMLYTPSDSGYIVAGVTESTDGDITDNEGIWDYWVVKLDSIGGIIWQKTYGGSSIDQCNDIIQTVDGGYLLVGYSYSEDGDITEFHGNADVWLVKITEAGEIEWQKNYGGSYSDIASSFLISSDGYYVFAGTSNSMDGDVSNHNGEVGTTSDFWIVKLDSFGDIVWERNFGSNENDFAYDIVETSNNDYVICGVTFGSDGDVGSFHGASDFWVIKVSSIGNLIWEKALGGSNPDIANSICVNDVNSYVVIGETESDDGDIVDFNGGPSDILMAKLDSSGNLISSLCYGGSGNESSYNIASTFENNNIFSGTSSSNDGDLIENNGSNDFWIVMCDSIGTIVWQKSMGGTLDETAYSCNTNYDLQSFTLTGRTHSSDGDLDFNHGNYDYWVVKLNVCEKIFYSDYDGDGFGNINNDSIACDIPFGYVIDSTDCNDSLNYINPSAKELCNYFDDDCDAIVDDNVTSILSYQDADADNFGNTLIDSISCELPIGFVLDNTDCDDTNQDIYPGAEELLNGLDDDCDQIVDEGLAINDIVKNTISIYPNPATNILFIQSNANYTITILNQLGKVIQHSKLLIGLNTIDVEDFASGVYWVKVENGEMVVWVKE